MEFNGLFCGSLEDKTAGRIADDGGLPCEVSKGNKDTIRVTCVTYLNEEFMDVESCSLY